MEIYESDKDTVKHNKNAFLKVNAFPESDIFSDLGLGHCIRPKQVTSWCGICLNGGGQRSSSEGCPHPGRCNELRFGASLKCVWAPPQGIAQNTNSRTS